MRNYFLGALFHALFLTILCIPNGICQQNETWDDTKSKRWPTECKRVEIPSSADDAIQQAYFYKSNHVEKRPLIVSLHTWSGNFEQKDTLIWQCIEKGYHYIHPDFRGPNYTYEACGSPLVISDIDDAISYAINHARVDTENMHIIGTSGGGYATLLAYMNTDYQVKTFSAWVPISNLIDWYHESKGRKNKYARHIAMATTGQNFENNHSTLKLLSYQLQSLL